MGPLHLVPVTSFRSVFHICIRCIWLISDIGQNSPGGPLIKEDNMSALIFSAAVALIYTADRTGFWLKEQKQFNPWTFAFLSLSCLGFGLATVSRGDKDLGFLNREQTDEWKGWMQSQSCCHIARPRYLTSLCSCYSHISLSWRIKNIWNIQSDPRSRSGLSIYDRLRSYHILH